MSKKIIATLLTFSIILGLSACGNASVETVDISNNQTVKEVEVIKEVEVVKEVPVVSVETIYADKVVIDTTSEATDSSFRRTIDTTNMFEVYFGQPRFFKSNEGTVWTSDNPEIAIVNSCGMVTAIDEGTTTIRCMNDAGEETATYNIYCTTSNDGQDIEKLTTFSNDGEISRYYNYHSPEELQARISTIRDVMALIKERGMWYEPNTPILATQCFTWAEDAETFLTYNAGVCCDVANLAAYLLQYDYEELGFIYHHGKRIGHVYNYVYEDGFYYVFDLTEVLDDHSNRSYDEFDIVKLESLDDYVPYIINNKTDPELLLGVIAVNSLNHTEQPCNYMSYMQDDSVIFNESTRVGFEEGVPTQVLYTNPKAAGLFEYISVPSEDIPYEVPAWFRNEELNIKNNWRLY